MLRDSDPLYQIRDLEPAINRLADAADVDHPVAIFVRGPTAITRALAELGVDVPEQEPRIVVVPLASLEASSEIAGLSTFVVARDVYRAADEDRTADFGEDDRATGKWPILVSPKYGVPYSKFIARTRAPVEPSEAAPADVSPPAPADAPPKKTRARAEGGAS